ncbi:16630_t:CDS:2 [Rhizophagus irregularis]|nr:16630_t:CDS:2 [Rhizophagus irregularis]
MTVGGGISVPMLINSCLKSPSPYTSQHPDKCPSHIYSSQSDETMLTSSLNIEQDVAVWKQEYIVLATNLLANLNEMEFITNNINPFLME